jgi:hypothetical protein
MFALAALIGFPCAALWMRRRWWLAEQRALVLRVIEHARSLLQDAWQASAPSTGTEFGSLLKQRLEKLEGHVPDAQRDELHTIDRAAREAGRKRAQWLSPTCVACEGVSCVRQMELWGVPRNYVKGQLYPLLALTQGTPPSASALEQIFDEYDYWEHYTEWYVQRLLPPITLVLVALFLEGLGWALYYGMWKRELVPGFLLAGASGAALSILLKQSAMVVYGQLIKSWLGMAARFAMGLVATMLGFGLLGWGLVGIGFGGGASGDTPVSLAAMVAACSTCVDDEHACIWCDTPMPSQPGGAAAAEAADAGTPADAGPDASPADTARGGVAAPSTTAKSTPRVKRSSNEKNGSGNAPSDSPCSAAWMAGLLGLGLLFGFSERAFMGILANFDSQFGGRREPEGKAPVAPATPPPPQK